MQLEVFISELIKQQDIAPGIDYAAALVAAVDNRELMARWMVAHWLFHDVGTASIVAQESRPFWMMVTHAANRLPRGKFSPASRFASHASIAGLQFAFPDPMLLLNELLLCNSYEDMLESLGSWSCFAAIDYVYIAQSMWLYGKAINLNAIDFATVGDIRVLSPDVNRLVAETVAQHFGGDFAFLPSALLALNKAFQNRSVGYFPGQERAEIVARLARLAATRCPLSSMNLAW